jgi:HK97 family phage portal protein
VFSALIEAFSPRADTEAQIAGRAEAWTPGAGFMRKTLSGETVSPGKAMTLSTWFACVRAISEDLAKLPLEIFERSEDGSKKLAKSHTLYRMLKLAPNEEMSSFTFRELMNGWALTWGNAYAEIEKDGAGQIVAMWPIHPSRCWLHRVEGRIVLDVWMGDSNQAQPRAARLEMNEFVHIRGFGDDPLCGLSVIRLAAESIGLSIAAQTYGATFFGNGAMASIVIIHPKKLDEQGQTNLRESWKKKMSGANKNGVAVLWDDMKIEKMSIPPEEAQFLETRQLQVTEITRWFRMPPHIVQDLSRSTNNNIEHQGIEYATNTLSPWMVRWETELERKLLDERDQEAFDIKHNDKALMRGDSKSRAEFYRTMISTAAMYPNEARRAEDMPPDSSPGANKLYMQGAMMTLDQIAAGEQKPARTQVKPGEEPTEPTEKPEKIEEPTKP